MTIHRQRTQSRIDIQVYDMETSIFFIVVENGVWFFPFLVRLDIAKNYPPSLRIIVQETNLKKLKLGELFLITYKGILNLTGTAKII